MDEAVVTASESTPDNATKTTLTKEQRSQVAKEAAKRRWAKAKKLAAQGKNKGKKPAVAAKGKAGAKVAKRVAPREFSSALKIAEKRLAKAIQERAEHAAKYAVVSAEIPSLQQIILALKTPNGGLPPLPAFSLEQIVGDQPLAYPQTSSRPAAPPLPMQHPVTTAGRAQGGAVGVELAESEDEDRFLKESGVASGEWR